MDTVKKVDPYSLDVFYNHVQVPHKQAFKEKQGVWYLNTLYKYTNNRKCNLTFTGSHDNFYAYH